MANKTRAPRVPGLVALVGQGLLLAPEAVPLAVLLCIHLAWGAPLAALLAALLVIVFMIRAAALHAARALIERGQAEKAGALLRLALLLYPGSPDGLALEGAAALAHGDAELAEARLRRAVALLPGQPAYLAAFSGALLDLGQPVEAAEAAQAALALDPRCALAHLHLAEAERALGAPAQIIEERLRAGLAAAPGPAAEAVLRCVLASHLLAEHRIAEAMLTLHGAEALLPRCSSPAQAALRFHLGQILSAQGQTERAQEYLKSAAALDPQSRCGAGAWRIAQL